MAAPPGSPPAIGIPPNIAAIAGPILLGYMFDWAFFALLSLQVYQYYTSFPNDSYISKALVYTLYSLDLVQTILLTWDAWRMFASGYGNPVELLQVGFIWLTIPVFCGVVSMFVQTFFAWRLYLLSKSWLLAGFIVAMSWTQGISAIVAGSQARIIDNFSLIPIQAFKATMIWLVGSAACDVCIAGFMIYFLAHQDTGFRETRAIIRRLIVLTIETGTMTAFLATLTIILFGIYRHETYYTCPSLVIAKSYAISAIVLFNNRTKFRPARAPSGTNELVSTMAWTPQHQHFSIGQTATSMTAGEGVRIDREQWSDSIEMNNKKTGADFKSSEIKLDV